MPDALLIGLIAALLPLGLFAAYWLVARLLLSRPSRAAPSAGTWRWTLAPCA